ncbi:MAG: hypothetical protein Q9184_007799 [Pyrenodesmia sp. 2 TL-2023]
MAGYHGLEDTNALRELLASDKVAALLKNWSENNEKGFGFAEADTKKNPPPGHDHLRSIFFPSSSGRPMPLQTAGKQINKLKLPFDTAIHDQECPTLLFLAGHCAAAPGTRPPHRGRPRLVRGVRGTPATMDTQPKIDKCHPYRRDAPGENAEGPRHDKIGRKRTEEPGAIIG